MNDWSTGVGPVTPSSFLVVAALEAAPLSPVQALAAGAVTPGFDEESPNCPACFEPVLASDTGEMMTCRCRHPYHAMCVA